MQDSECTIAGLEDRLALRMFCGCHCNLPENGSRILIDFGVGAFCRVSRLTVGC